MAAEEKGADKNVPPSDSYALGNRVGTRGLKRRASTDSQNSTTFKMRATEAVTGRPVPYDKQLSLNLPSTSSAYRSGAQGQPHSSTPLFNHLTDQANIHIKHEEPVPNMAVVVPLNLSTIENPPDNLEPRRRAQLAVLKHLFTLNCDWTMETAKTFDYIINGCSSSRAEGPLTRGDGLLQVAQHGAVEADLAEEHKSEWKITTIDSAAPGMTGKLKLRLSRQTEAGESEVDSEPDSNSEEDLSEENDDNSGDERVRRRMSKKKRKKERKEKKKKRRKEELALNMEHDAPSPVEMNIDKGGGIRMKIRLGGGNGASSSRPPSRTSQ
ncbi:hypothetical protein WR25_06658 [Diploscapter pachys]|uniref:Uncharacterized protein n=1 Tax=Diploscapter pachys TaxID=2018661 RepID=A0A2A2JUK7_9BILA|nr:hypothetical protein WR25_06658 [Diploscapter pachys]